MSAKTISITQAKTYDDWVEAVRRGELQKDIAKDLQKWISNPRSRYYNSDMISTRLVELNHYMHEDILTPNKATAMLGVALFRNIGDICNEKLFSVSRLSTKAQIEEYIDLVCELVEWIFKCPMSLYKSGDAISHFKNVGPAISAPDGFSMTHSVEIANTIIEGDEASGYKESLKEPESKGSEQSIHTPLALSTETLGHEEAIPFPKEKYSFFQECIRMYGRTALIFNGPLMYFFCNVGMSKALFDAKLLPSIICGTDLGGIFISSILCVFTDEQLSSFFKDQTMLYDVIKTSYGQYSGSDLSQVTSSTIGENSALNLLKKLTKSGFFFNRDAIEQILSAYFGDTTLKEAYDRTGRTLNAIISPSDGCSKSLLLNRFTFPEVTISSIIRAIMDDMEHGVPMNLEVKHLEPTMQPYVANTEANDLARESFTIYPLLASELPWEATAEGKKKIMGSRLAELLHVNNYIISQVRVAVPCSSRGRPKNMISTLSNFFMNELFLALELLDHIGFLPYGFSSMLYRRRCDIVLPVSKEDLYVEIGCNIQWTDLIALMRSSPLLTSFVEHGYACGEPLIRSGERSIWGELNKLRVRMRIEQLIESILRHLSPKTGGSSSFDRSARRKRSNSSTKSLRSSKTRSMY